jgi:4-hydroxy-3-methylbut-2-enyl diphosphate reductase
MMDEARYFRRGLGNRDNVIGLLRADYYSGLVEYFKANAFRYRHGQTELRLAREFGFCYGVDRAVEYAYETRDRFPDRRIWITGEIIHNPGVNRRLEAMGIRFLPPRREGADRLLEVAPDDVVLIPAFGADHAEFERLRRRGVILVDTTCGSVLTVWKSVERYARSGRTAIVHGKFDHEETRATCSQVRKHHGHYLVVRDREEAELVCSFLAGRLEASELLARLPGAYSEGFDPETHLARIGLANQTTMLSSESLEIAEMLREAILRRHGPDSLPERFESFDTICSATQERQDAVLELIRDGCDLMIVIGGFNSSNTSHLVEISSRTTPTFHIEDAENLISPTWIRHKPFGQHTPVVVEGWLQEGPLVIGLTAGASTPNSEIGRSVHRLLRFRGVAEEVIAEISGAGGAQMERNRAKERPSSEPGA